MTTFPPQGPDSFWSLKDSWKVYSTAGELHRDVRLWSKTQKNFNHHPCSDSNKYLKMCISCFVFVFFNQSHWNAVGKHEGIYSRRLIYCNIWLFLRTLLILSCRKWLVEFTKELPVFHHYITACCISSNWFRFKFDLLANKWIRLKHMLAYNILVHGLLTSHPSCHCGSFMKL